MTWRQIFKPGRLQIFDHMANYSPTFNQWADQYSEKYIQTRSITPLWHAMGITLVLSYAMGYPSAMEHKEHDRDAALPSGHRNTSSHH